jgi:hypothetical protein
LALQPVTSEKQGETSVEGAKPYLKSLNVPFCFANVTELGWGLSDVLMLQLDTPRDRIRDSLAIAEFFRFWIYPLQIGFSTETTQTRPGLDLPISFFC